MSRLIQGTLKFPDSSPIAGATIRFIASKFIYTGVPVGVSHDFTTDTFGYYSEDILEGSYHVFFKQSGQDVFTHLTDAILAPLVDGDGVPLGDPSTLEDIIGENLPEEPVYANCGNVPSPTSFTVTGAFTTIILGWEGTSYTCHDVTEIWVNTVDNLATASYLDTTQAAVYSHSLGNDAAVYYWIRFRNKNDVTGNWFSTSGKFAQTSQDPGKVLDDLQEDIYNSTIFSSLRTNINSSFYQATAPTTKPNGDDLVSGDTWIDSDDSQRYVWDTSQVPPAWLAVTDKETIDAVQSLVDTQEVADGQIRGFFQTTEPVAGMDFGDLWIDTSQATPLTVTAIYRYEADDGSSTGTLSWRTAPGNALGISFIKAYNADAAITDILTGETALDDAVIDGTNLVSYITGTTENMVKVYSGASGGEPTTGVSVGDLYIETNVAGVVTTFRYSNLDTDPVTQGWVEIKGSSNVAALADLTDGKRTIYTTPGVPKDTDADPLTIKINDLWIPIANICTDDTSGDVVTCGTSGSSIAYRAEEIYRCTAETVYAADGTTITTHPVFIAATKYHDLIESLDENLQAQIDNKIQTYAQDTLPYANDIDTVLNLTLDKKVGDLWLCTADSPEYSSGSYYEYSRTANGDNYDYSWTLKADITSGLSELVGNKRTIYGGETIPNGTPQPLLANDLWIPTDNVIDGSTTYNQGEMYTWTGSAWDLASRYSADILALSDRTIFIFYLPGGVYTESSDSFATPPALDTDAGIPAPEVNDLWVITDRDDEVRRYNGTTWVLLHVATLANVDTKIIEQKGICKISASTLTGDPKVGTYLNSYKEANCTGTITSLDNSAYDWTLQWEEMGALAKRTDTVSTTVGDHTTTISEQATSINGLESKYSVKIDNNGNVSGFGLSSGSAGCLVDGVLDSSIAEAACTGTGKEWVTDSSTFLVAADSFAVTGTNETPVTPFIVRTGGTGGTCYVNGVANTALNETTCGTTTGGSWVAANTSVVGIQGTLVLDGSMNADSIVAGSIGADHIGAGVITAEEMNTSSAYSLTIQHPSYTAADTNGAGGAGWKIARDGTVEFESGKFRGDITGASGTFSGSLNIDKGSGTDNRIVITDDVIKVYDAGILRVKLGDLA